ncbi:MAG: polysaccharide biosynthesis C-terminal domain-containing protein [Bacteroidota bacterium]|nr:polysaccharide biosynthesis C-terminal domain-containing protein [Bacteroidota bacterium]
MIRPVIGTIATRVMVMLMNIAVIMIAGHRLGANGLGDISLVVLGITFILLLSNVIGGGAIVYLLPRHHLRTLLLPSYAWAVITSLIAFMVIENFKVVPTGTEIHVVILALLQSIYTIHFNVLLGRERIHVINLLQLLQATILIVAFAILIERAVTPDVMIYVKASYFAFATTGIVSAITISMFWRSSSSVERSPVIGKMIRQGGSIQIANFLQLLNYRLAYYLLERYQGLSALGIYSVSNQLAESAWLGPKSIASVLYGKVSNTPDPLQNQRLTITAAKVSVLMALAVIVVVALVPDHVYQWLFGEEITGMSEIILLLSPGIIAMSISQALSHYYSGSGLNVHNAAGSAIGVAATLCFGFWLIPAWGIAGAAMTASIAYLLNTIYQLIVFLRTTGTPLAKFWLNADDRQQISFILKWIR